MLSYADDVTVHAPGCRVVCINSDLPDTPVEEELVGVKAACQETFDDVTMPLPGRPPFFMDVVLPCLRCFYSTLLVGIFLPP